MLYYMAVRSDGKDFYTNSINCLAGGTIVHPDPNLASKDPAKWLSLSTVAGDCIGFSWPCRLFEVEADDTNIPNPTVFPYRVAASAFTVTQELNAFLLFGPNGQQVVNFLNLLPTITVSKLEIIESIDLKPDWNLLWGSPLNAALNEAWSATFRRIAYRTFPKQLNTAWSTRALVLRNQINEETFMRLTAPVRSVGIDFDEL